MDAARSYSKFLETKRNGVGAANPVHAWFPALFSVFASMEKSVQLWVRDSGNIKFSYVFSSNPMLICSPLHARYPSV